jgi:hypothetical protein
MPHLRALPLLLLLAVAGRAKSQTAAKPSAPALVVPDWCRALPRPEYKTL